MSFSPSRNTLLAILVLGLASGAFAGKKKKSAEAQRADPIRNYQLGVAHLQGGRPDLAVVELEKSVSGEPDNLVAVYALGLAYYGVHEHAKAKQVFEGLLERDPLFTEAHNSLGLVLIAEGDRVAARQEFERVLADKRYLTPEVAQFNLGALLLEDGLLSEALGYLRSASVARPENPEWRFRYALALEQDKQFEAAKREIEAALHARPTFVEALFHLGTVSLQLQDQAGARRAFGRVRDLAPNTDAARQAMERLKELGD